MNDHFEFAVLGAIVALVITAYVILSITDSGGVSMHDVLVAAVSSIFALAVGRKLK